MIHAVCDFCGHDADRSAMFLTVTPFQNFARYHTDTVPYGNADKTASFVMCQACYKKHDLLSPYNLVSDVYKDRKVSYENTLEGLDYGEPEGKG